MKQPAEPSRITSSMPTSPHPIATGHVTRHAVRPVARLISLLLSLPLLLGLPRLPGLPRLRGLPRLPGLLCAAAPVRPAHAARLDPDPEPGTTALRAFASDRPFSSTVQDTYLCPLRILERTPQRCPPFGPGTRDVRLTYLRAHLRDPLPALPIVHPPAPEGSVTAYTYGRIVHLPAPTYRHPSDAATGQPPLRVFLSNINWVSVVRTLEVDGQTWVQINAEEYVEAQHIDFPAPSRFQGVLLTADTGLPFGWLRRELHPSPEPGAPPSPDLTLPRREIATIYASVTVDGSRWDMIGPDRWVEHDWVAQVTPVSPPAGVPAGAKWIDVDTYEQTLAAYEGDRMVYATLITAGKSDLTPLGLFRIFRKVRGALMQSYDRAMDDAYWFHLEDVEHAQFFNDRISLHAAYWHDHFGTSRSNGCINLAPLDAAWLYTWTDPQLPPGGSWVTAESAGEGQTWVWVHHIDPPLARKPMVW